MKLLIVSPHLSTGGCPQYLFDFLKNKSTQFTDIKIIEFSNFSDVYVIQKEKIKNFVGAENLICLGNYWDSDDIFYANKYKILDIIKDYSPDVIWFNEFPECFEYKLPPEDLISKIYSPDRKYKIIETTHCNHFDFQNKKFIPDEFMFCSDLHIHQSININIPKTVWEVPIENKIRPDRNLTLKKLNLDPDYLHVLHVGILNSNKNQKYIFNLAEKLQFYKIQFHFIGNDCFLNECGISEAQLKLKNCKIWGERSDVDDFMSCMDVFIFPSIKELNPLSVKEALSWKMDVYCKYCDTYVNKYKNFNNFHLLEDVDIKKELLDKLKTIEKTKKKIRFALYTSFYNCEKYVDQIFKAVSNINYDNYSWFITDDYSNDNTKSLILKKMVEYKNIDIKYCDQKHKKEMYWQYNNFISQDYDYIVLLDADDLFDSNFLKIYNKYLIDNPQLFFISSDFSKIEENSKNLHSLSLVKNEQPISEKIKKFHPQPDYLNNLDYYCFGTLRCFKNVKDLQFEIKDFDACAEDSYHSMYINSYGKWLHLPRNMYTWNYRIDSESHQKVKDNFNSNFEIAFNKAELNKIQNDYRFNDVYLETCAINYLGFERNKSFSLFTKNESLNILNDLFFDLNYSVNNFDEFENYIIILNYYDDFEISNIIRKLKNKNANILFYYQHNEKYETNKIKDEQIELINKTILNKIGCDVKILNWYSYIRHFYVSCCFDLSLIKNNKYINILDFDREKCHLTYALSESFENNEGDFKIQVFDLKNNFVLYSDSLTLIKGFNYWSAFDYCRSSVYKDILLQFEYKNKIVLRQKLSLYDSPNLNAIFFDDMDFEKKASIGSFIEVFKYNHYNNHDVYVEKDDIVVDIGSNIGAFVKLALINQCKEIHIIEPNPFCVEMLKKHFSLENVHINNYAISDKNTKTNLFLNDNLSACATIIREIQKDNSWINVQINGLTFKDFIINSNIKKINFLKIDCEGAEKFIFIEDNFDFIKNNVDKIVVEFHDQNTKNEIEIFLSKAGFDFKTENFNPAGLIYAKNKNRNSKIIQIINESGSLGDTLAWVPVVSQFANQKNCTIDFYTNFKFLFNGLYNNINFLNYDQQSNFSYDQTYKIGCFDEKHWKTVTLQKVASDILGIEYKKEIPNIHKNKITERIVKEKYVCIAIQSTAQCKYWNRTNGWFELVNYLNNLGYKVVCVDKYPSFGTNDCFNVMPSNCIDMTGKDLDEVINLIHFSEFFIGLSSGLAWLAWALQKEVIMISGFSANIHEFETKYRVRNDNVCNSCWNDLSLTFDRSNWMWCPRNKNFECSKEITVEMVKEKIDQCINDLKIFS